MQPHIAFRADAEEDAREGASSRRQNGAHEQGQDRHRCERKEKVPMNAIL